MRTGEVWMCNCSEEGGHPVIVLGESEFATRDHKTSWLIFYSASTISNPTRHPDPDRVWAEYTAAKLRGEI